MSILKPSVPTLSADLEVVGFLGSDGVGTTTHAEHASEFFESRGLRTHTEWMRFNHRLSLPVLGFGRLLGKTPEYHDENGNTLRAHHFEDSSLLSAAYEKVLPVDQRLMVKQKLESVPDDADALVCDRFILDGLVDLVVATKDISLLGGSTADQFWELVPSQATIIGLDCDPETIAARRPDVAPDPFLELRTKVYRRLFENDRIEVVDTSKPIEDARRDVKNIINTQ
jgi:thymidylate kinase